MYRWVQRFTPLLIDAARPCRHARGDRWCVEETSVKSAGRWVYRYRAIDQVGQVIDVLVSDTDGPNKSGRAAGWTLGAGSAQSAPPCPGAGETIATSTTLA